MEAAQLLKAIHAAFGTLPVPPARSLLSYADSSAQAFRTELAGKRWQDLSASFWTKRWACCCYLSPEAYRYYLPSLLVAALQEFPSDDGLVSSVVFHLRPDFHPLYYQGEDSVLRARLSILSTDQYRAVSAFLGLAFDQLPRLRHLAAQALHWGWNTLDTPALQAVEAYYHELQSFFYPEPEDPETLALCREITTAFAHTPYPGDNRLCGSGVGDEPAEMAMELRGVQWQSAHPTLLAQCYSALSFLSAEGFRYFLPAFLLADLLDDEFDTGSDANPTFHLTYGFERPERQMDAVEKFALYRAAGILPDLAKQLGLSNREMQEMLERQQEQPDLPEQADRRARSMRRFMTFNAQERMAIIRYLEYRADDDFNGPTIQNALESYWRPSVQTTLDSSS
jgi:hypothetical protein